MMLPQRFSVYNGQPLPVQHLQYYSRSNLLGTICYFFLGPNLCLVVWSTNISSALLHYSHVLARCELFSPPETNQLLQEVTGAHVHAFSITVKNMNVLSGKPWYNTTFTLSTERECADANYQCKTPDFKITYSSI